MAARFVATDIGFGAVVLLASRYSGLLPIGHLANASNRNPDSSCSHRPTMFASVMTKIKALHLLLIVCLTCMTALVRADTVDIREWLIPWEKSKPGGPFADSSGRVWFASESGNYIANMSPESGEFNRYDLVIGTGPANLVIDAEKNIWFSAKKGRHIGKMNPATGQVTPHNMPERKARDPHSLVLDRGGNVWFSVRESNYIGMVNRASNSVSLIRLQERKMLPTGLIVDVHGVPWAAGAGSNKLLRVNAADMSVSEIALPREKSRPAALATTSDGAVWYADFALGAIGRYNPETMVFTEWPMPGGEDSKPFGITRDRDDRIWVVETGVVPNRFVGFDSASLTFLTETDIPSGAGTVRSLHYRESAGEIWFTTDTNYIGRARIH